MKNILSVKVCLILALGILASPVLFAHNSLVMSVPAEKATLHQSPEFIELRFSDETYLNAVTLVDAGGKSTPLDLDEVDELASYFKVEVPNIEPGKYTVTWQVVGMDTHKIEGKFEFAVMGSH